MRNEVYSLASTACCDVPVSFLHHVRFNFSMLAGSCNCATSPAGNMKNEVRRKEDKLRQKESVRRDRKPNVTM